MRIPLFWLWRLLRLVGLELSVDVEVTQTALEPLERGQLVSADQIREDRRIYLKITRRKP